MANRLALETSPYLLQHKDNPIDWYPWGDEAFLRAKLEDKPIFLSIGYSSCHWCHVMAHESFEDSEVALALNQSFICIKLDREERPDVDEIYMTAVQIANGHGGWPMSVFMTPEKKPFFVGTYFPRQSRGQQPGFLTILGSLATSWREDRQKVEEAAAQFTDHLQAVLNRSISPSQTPPNVSLLDACVGQHMTTFDNEFGGFGEAPKFPPHSALRLLEDYAALRQEMPDPAEGDLTAENLSEAAAVMYLMTLQGMALGGIHDMVGGGFHRYSTDGQWLLPHFEKMLYDNAQLLSAFHGASRLALEPAAQHLFASAAMGIVRWVKEEMTSPEGVFYSAIDADSEGEEGVFYTWTVEELTEVLGDDTPEVMTAFGITAEGNFLDEATRQRTGRNILHGASPADFQEELAKLREARRSRVRPGTDTKAICGWNGLMISALAKLGELEMAAQCAEAWLDARQDGLLPHQITEGKAAGTAFLDDYACFLECLMDLYQVTEDTRWLDAASEIFPDLISRFADNQRGGFFFAPHDGELLIGRTKPFFDNAMPSGNGVALRILARLGMFEQGVPHLLVGLAWAEKMPASSETVLSALLYWLLAGGVEVEPAPPVSVAAAPAAPAIGEIKVFFTPREIVADKDGWGHSMVTISLPEGVHINTNEPPARWLTPTQLKVEGVFGEAGFPASDNDRYEGEVTIPVRLRAKKGTEEFGLTVIFQPCTDSECLAPMERQFGGVLIVE